MATIRELPGELVNMVIAASRIRAIVFTTVRGGGFANSLSDYRVTTKFVDMDRLDPDSAAAAFLKHHCPLDAGASMRRSKRTQRATGTTGTTGLAPLVAGSRSSTAARWTTLTKRMKRKTSCTRRSTSGPSGCSWTVWPRKVRRRASSSLRSRPPSSTDYREPRGV